jgi:hypothetical protein
VIENEQRRLVHSGNLSMTIEQATQIEMMSGGVVGDNFSEKFNDLITKAVQYQMTVDPVF